MKPLSVMLAALAMVALFACSSAPKPEPAKESSSASQPAPEAPPPAARDDRPAIVAFGDSITAGYGLEPGKSYPDDLQRLIDKAGYRYRVVNMGVSGDTTTDGLERIDAVLAAKPAIVILEFGGNDGLRGQPVNASEKNLAAMIEKLQGAGVKVILAGMTLPRNYGSEYITKFDAMFRDVAKRYHLTLIPFLLEDVGGVPQLTQPDGLHPTTEGAEIVARNAWKYLSGVLKKP